MTTTEQHFASINAGYERIFKPGKLTLGIVSPIETYASSPVPTMHSHIERIKLIESLGFTAVWIRDVPFNVPTFGDAGQLFDPFVYLGHLAASTSTLALGVASAILPLRHPAHVAKAAFSTDVLSNGRLILGIASGDRPEEYPALNMNFHERSQRFRDSYHYIRQLSENFPQFDNHYGTLQGHIDMLPKPTGHKIPMLITGGSQQSPEWLAEHGDGWMIYPRDIDTQTRIVNDWRTRTYAATQCYKPVMQPLHIALQDDPDAGPRPIHLGFSCGINYLHRYLHALETAGINHVALNLRFNLPTAQQTNIETTLARLADALLPEYA